LQDSISERMGHTRSADSAADCFRNLESMAAGTLIHNRYELGEFLGRGGFGVVFAAHDRILRSEVALKFLHPGLSRSPRKFQRVRREINLSRRIVDSRIVRVFSLESWQELFFLVMERVHGRSLGDYLAERKDVSWEDFKPVFMQILNGVGILHRHGIVHRDLKPSNIFLVAEGIKILDFGMAKAMDDPEQTSELGEVVGSPLYMSPEQIAARPVGVASDIYQLGLILYRALSGRHAYPADTSTFNVLMRKLQAPPPMMEPQQHLPGFLRQVVAHALEKNPKNRFASVESMAAALERGRLPRWRKPSWRLNRVVLGVGLLLLSLAAGFWIGHPLRIAEAAFAKDRVQGKNTIGIPLWSKSFAPMSVYRATLFSLNRAVPEFWQAAPRGRMGVRALIVPPQNKQFPADFSLGTLAADSRLVVLDGRGRELFNKDFFKTFKLCAHGYSRRFYASRYSQEDLNGDGLPEQVMLVRHSQGMFPSALVVLRGGSFSVFTSPGVIRHYRILAKDHNGITLQLTAMANPLAHMSYLAKLRMRLKGPCQFVHGLPDLNAEQAEHGPDWVLPLPRGARIKREGPGETVVFHDQDTRDQLVCGPGGEVRILRGGRVAIRFRDDPGVVAAALDAVQRAYTARLRRRDVAAARSELARAFSASPRNPYLLSALYCLRGDLQVEAAAYTAARDDLEAALEAYPFNMDAACRLCEVAFLQGRTEEAERLVTERFGDHFNFWGLSNGRRLFRLWLDLHNGRLHMAREKVAALFFDKPALSRTYEGLIDLFAGDYSAACEAFENASSLPPNLFTLAEFRLFYARALVAANRHPERARFFLRDLETHSLRQGWRAGLLLAWLEARTGERSPELKRRAREAWRCIRDRSRGDFQARLWLFLDAWCYGRVMHALGDMDAARDGYRACVAANPHSGAARDARIRVGPGFSL